MGFAEFYFEKFQVSEQLISQKPESNLKQIVVIPSFKENSTIEVLKSLYFCLPTIAATEVIVLINYPKKDELQYSEFHHNQYEELTSWALKHSSQKLTFHICLKPLETKDAGVGLARKTLMDEAVRRFNYLNNPNGIIINLDADCTCESNYLQAIENIFANDSKMPGCSIYFEHPLQGTDYEQNIYSAIIQYELYLRYYVEALRMAGFPNAYHTIGSAFAVRAEAYIRQGGMNKRKAGEDFYFLHKIIPIGNFRELNETCIYPSPRQSDRVPFGTGAAVIKIVESGSYLYYTFSLKAFVALKQLFENVPNLYKANDQYIEELLNMLHPSLRTFLIKNVLQKSLHEFNSNCASFEPFKKRFYAWFNGLMVLQYLNDCHMNEFVKIPVTEAASELLSIKELPLNAKNDLELLQLFRKIQKAYS